VLYRDFNDMGIPVFGLHGVTTDGFCECLNPKCDALYKHPKNSSWQNTPVWSEEQLEVMELTDSFATGYGVLCNDLIVIDVDARNGGLESYAKLVERCPEILDCEFIVETGSGGGSRHLYFKNPKTKKINSHHPDFKGIDFKSSGFVVGAGSKHKSGRRYVAVHGEPSDIQDAPSSLIALLEAKEVVRHTSNYEGQKIILSDADIGDMLDFIDGSSFTHDEWLQVGMSIHHATNGGGFNLWTQWSSKSPKSSGKSWEKKWKSFGKSANVVTVGTLIHLAKQNGYVLKNNIEIETIPSSIDWTKKPTTKTEFNQFEPVGLVGRITKWINSRSQYPRENIAVAAALMAVSSTIGLRYRGLNNTAGNLFMFCVAGSGTGKENVMQCYNALMRETGVASCVHGNIISEQEVARNIVDHQMALYNIDEFGETLNKIQNARKRGGGSSHLEGLIGALMNVYSKSNGLFLIPNTHRKTFREDLLKKIAFYEKQKKENEFNDMNQAELDSLKRRYDDLASGISNPFVNILGFTAPTKFNGLLDEDLADSGFFARALIVREMDDNPRAKDWYDSSDFKDDEELKQIAKILKNLYFAGHSDKFYRVELQGEKIHMPVSEKCKALLKQIQDDFWHMGEEQKENQGFVAYTRRGAEMVNKLSLVLSAGENEITEEAILWAFEYVKKDMHDKILLTAANTMQATGEGLLSRIMTILDADTGVSMAQLKNKIRNYKVENIESAINHLVENKQIEQREIKPQRGQTTVKYFKL